MYAIIETGGKQYRVAEGDELKLERIPGSPEDTVTFERVLAVGRGDAFRVGAPFVEGARVVGRVLGHGRARKIQVFRYRPKKRVRRRVGHRQAFTRVRVEKIEA